VYKKGKKIPSVSLPVTVKRCKTEALLFVWNLKMHVDKTAKGTIPDTNRIITAE